MKLFITKTVEVKRIIHTDTKCDLCNKIITTESNYDKFSSQFNLIEGNSFPEGDFSDTTKIDFCNDCAHIVLNKLKEIGCNIVTFSTEDGEESCQK